MRPTRTSTRCSIESIQSIFKKFKVAWSYSFNNKIAKNFSEMLTLWHESLGDFPDVVVLRACRSAIDECKFLPSIAEYRKLCREVTPKVVASIMAPQREEQPPEWYLKRLELTDIIKKIHYPNNKYDDLITSAYTLKLQGFGSLFQKFRGTVAWEVGQIIEVYKRQVDCKDGYDVDGFKRAIQIANADLARTEHERTLQ